jgi:amphiphysin
MQRQFGKLTHKGGSDDAKVSVLLQDFDGADKMLTKVCSQFKTFLGRD